MVLYHFYGHPWRLVGAVLKIGCAVHYCYTHICHLAPTSGPSMLPTFSVAGDCVLVNNLHRRNRKGALRVGDLVVFRIPITDESYGLKRIVGMPGDYVCAQTPGEDGEHLMLQVPEGHCWVVGDNLPASRDSRLFGPLPLGLVQGKAFAKALPLAEFSFFRNPMQPVDSE